jgi:hypothetical protein
VTQPFDAAMARFQFLLRHEGWPEAVSWTTADQVVVFPMRTTCIYRPGRPDEHGAARARFSCAGCITTCITT